LVESGKLCDKVFELKIEEEGIHKINELTIEGKVSALCL